jgi:hypothetical protein
MEHSVNTWMVCKTSATDILGFIIILFVMYCSNIVKMVKTIKLQNALVLSANKDSRTG